MNDNDILESRVTGTCAVSEIREVLGIFSLGPHIAVVVRLLGVLPETTRGAVATVVREGLERDALLAIQN